MLTCRRTDTLLVLQLVLRRILVNRQQDFIKKFWATITESWTSETMQARQYSELQAKLKPLVRSWVLRRRLRKLVEMVRCVLEASTLPSRGVPEYDCRTDQRHNC